LCRWKNDAKPNAHHESAQFESLAQPPQHRRFLLVRLLLEGAGDVIRALALLAVIDEVVLGDRRAQPLQDFGIKARPEEREVADVAVHLAAGAALARDRFGLHQHVGDLLEPAAGAGTELVDRVHVHETGQQFGQIIDERGVGHAQVGHERLLGDAGEIAPQRVIGVVIPHGL